MPRAGEVGGYAAHSGPSVHGEAPLVDTAGDAQVHTEEGHGRLDAVVLVGDKDGAEVVDDTNAGEHAGRRVQALVSYADNVFRERGKVVSLLIEIEAPRVDECLMDLRAGEVEVIVSARMITNEASPEAGR